MRHPFIFTPGEWLGEGKITFSASPIELRFFTHWDIRQEQNGLIQCVQKVEVQEGGDAVINTFAVSDVLPAAFTITLSNEMVGKVTGTGVLDGERIAWEFRDLKDFQGFEVYELQPDGEYTMNAEYLAEPDYRTHIKGKIWKKGPRK